MENNKNMHVAEIDAAAAACVAGSTASSSLLVEPTTSLDQLDNETTILTLRNTAANSAKDAKATGAVSAPMKTMTTLTTQTTPNKIAINNTTTTAKIITTTTKQLTSSSESSASTQQTEFPVQLHYIASFHRICVITALLPLATLFTCFVTAYVFQYDEVHETHCRVYNVIPSISAITGVSPQRYFWRLTIALHLGPRIPITYVYKNYYLSLLDKLQKTAPEKVQFTKFLINLIWIMNCIEIASLGGVTYISNRENYPIHEKIFITFMICSLCHMLATLKLNAILHDDLERLTHHQRESLKWKRILFIASIFSTIGLLIFFAKHRFYCHDLAFTWFAFFEYCIAIANMLFHFTIIWDFPSQYMIVVQGSRSHLERIFNADNKKSD